MIHHAVVQITHGEQPSHYEDYPPLLTAAVALDGQARWATAGNLQ